MSGMPIFIGYYTPHYKGNAQKLESSLVVNKLEYAIYKAACRGSWDANTKIKTEIIEHALKEYKKPVVYVDADAVIRSRPSLFESLDCDFSCHRKGGAEVLSGTLYFNTTDKSFELLDIWRRMNHQQPKTWDQRNLKDALDEIKDLNEYALPPAYCQIFDSMKHHGKAVIEHFQASRRLKRRVNMQTA